MKQMVNSADVKVGTFSGFCLSLFGLMPFERIVETIFLAAVGAVVSLLVSRLMQQIFKKKE